MKYIELTKGKRAIVDDEDYDELTKNKWYASRSCSTYYARCKRGGKINSMHRIIMKDPAGKEIDHINHDGLDNRKSNLRLCNRTQQARNALLRKNVSSKYKGVSWESSQNRWRATIRFGGKWHLLGRYDCEKEARDAYNRAAKKHFGAFAYTGTD